MTIGQRLKFLRLERKLSKIEVGHYADIHPSLIALCENDKIIPRSKYLIKFSNFYGVTIDYILGLSRNRINTEDLESGKDILDGLPPITIEFLNDLKKFINYKYGEDRAGNLIKMIDKEYKDIV